MYPFRVAVAFHWADIVISESERQGGVVESDEAALEANEAKLRLAKFLHVQAQPYRVYGFVPPPVPERVIRRVQEMLCRTD